MLAGVNEPRFAIRQHVPIGFSETLDRVPAALRHQGLGVLGEIDMQGTLAKKLGVGFRRYRIFSVCHPSSAYRVLNQDLDVGVLLPCNLAVYEDDRGDSIVAAVDPLEVIAKLTADSHIREVAMEIRERLVRVIEEIAREPPVARAD